MGRFDIECSARVRRNTSPSGGSELQADMLAVSVANAAVGCIQTTRLAGGAVPAAGAALYAAGRDADAHGRSAACGHQVTLIDWVGAVPAAEIRAQHPATGSDAATVDHNTSGVCYRGAVL